MLDRNEIITFLKDFSIEKDYVNAMWLEGADGINKVDEYSDIDFWFDVNKEYQESFLYECISALETLGSIDSRVDEIREVIAQSNIHLANTSPYLTLDICVQSHQIRGKGATCYYKDDIAEVPLVIFDKIDLITYCDRELNIDEIKEEYENARNRILQMSRVEKYIHRKQYLETYMKYISNIADSLVVIARLIYTPRLHDYGLCHISDHLPKEEVDLLESFYKVISFTDIENNLHKAKDVLERYAMIIKEKYNI